MESFSHPPSSGRHITFSLLALVIVLSVAVATALYVEENGENKEVFSHEEAAEELPVPTLAKRKLTLPEDDASAAPTLEAISPASAPGHEQKILQRLEALEQKVDALSQPSPEIAALRDELKRFREEMTAEIAQNKAPAAHATLLMDFIALKQQVESGKPFSKALSQLMMNPNLPDPIRADMSSLEETSYKGMPETKSLRELFDAALKSYLAAPEGKPSHPGVWTNIQGSMRNLVTVRKIGAEQSGNDNAARIARAEAAMKEDKIASALDEISQLKGGSAEAFSVWQDAASLRLKTLASLQEIQQALSQEIESPGRPPSRQSPGREAPGSGI